MTEPTTCPDDDRLVELALGTSTGRERADVLTHLLGCRACRERVDALVVVAERLLLAAPEAEPPVGFETAVLDRIDLGPPADAGVAPPATHPVTRGAPSGRGRVIRMAVAGGVAAVLLLAAGVGLDRFALRDPPSFAEAAMTTPSGYEVGTAWHSTGEPSWVLVSVPGWDAWDDTATAPIEYRLVAELDDGTTTELGPVTFDDDGGAWATTAPDTRRIRSLAVVDGTGHVWCSAQF